MQRLARQVVLRLVIVLAIAVGLVRPPFGSDAHADSGSASHIEAVQHADGHASSGHKHASAGHTHDDESGAQHDASDHCHIPSSLPPSVTGLALSSEWTRVADFEVTAPSFAAISFDRPPKPFIFA